MARTASSLTLFLGACLSLWSCGTTDAPGLARGSSFAPYKNASVGDSPLRSYALLRSAVVLAADRIDVRDAAESDSSFQMKGDGRLGFGCAAAVDRRGYFLTAAHGFENRSAVQMLIPAPDGTVRARRARIAWVGDVDPHGFDLALLHVDHDLDRVFDWAPEVRSDQPVVAVGLDFEFDDQANHYDLALAPLGGSTIEAISEKSDDIPYEVVKARVPVQQGDSGGPLLDLNGRLIGVTQGEEIVQWRFPFSLIVPNKSRGRVIRPNPEWLEDLIEQHQAHLRTSTARQLP